MAATSFSHWYEEMEKELIASLGVPAKLLESTPRSTYDMTKDWIKEYEERIRNLLLGGQQ